MTETTVTESDRCADIAAALHELALKFTDLIGTGVPVPFVQLSIQPGCRGDDESVAAAVDAISSVLFGHAGQLEEMTASGAGIYHYNNGQGSEPLGAVEVRIYNSVSAEFAAKREHEAEVARLRAEVVELEARIARMSEPEVDATLEDVRTGAVVDEQSCTCPLGPEGAHLADCPLYEASKLSAAGLVESAERSRGVLAFTTPIVTYFSFGSGHADPRTGEDLWCKYVTVVAPTYEQCREAMFASRFGNRWGKDYLAGTATATRWMARWTECEVIVAPGTDPALAEGALKAARDLLTGAE